MKGQLVKTGREAIEITSALQLQERRR